MRLFKRKKENEKIIEQPIQRLPAPKRINAFRYTYDAWKKENKNGTQLEYEKIVTPNNLFAFLTKFINNLNNKLEVTDKTEFAFVPIDGDYYKWLDDNQKSDNLHAKGEYSQTRTDDEIYRLMQNNGWDEEYEIVGIPIYAINSKLEEISKTYYKIENELKDKLVEYFENIYGKDNIYLPGYVLTQNDFFAGERDFVQIAKIHFQKGTNVKFIKWDEQKYANKIALIYPLVIPFAIRRKYENAVLNYAKLLSDVRWTPLLSLSSDGLKNFNIDSISFSQTEMYAKIKEYFGEKTIIMESVVRSCDIPEVNRQILSKLQ